MVGVGEPVLAPLFWPFGHTVSALSLDKKATAPARRRAPASPTHDAYGHFKSAAKALQMFALACAAVHYSEGGAYPAFGAAEALKWAWVWPLLKRNMLGAWAVATVWDWFLLGSPLAGKIGRYKFNPLTP